MSRQRRAQRLAELSPEEIGERVSERIREHVATWAAVSGPDLRRIATDAQRLTRWAQRGDGRTHDQSAGVCAELVRQLFSSPLVPASAEPPLDPDDPIQLMLSAALARLKIESSQPVPAVQLAALLGFDRSRIRQLVLSGEIRRTSAEQKRGRQMDAPILASDARHLLAKHDARTKGPST